MAADSPWHGFRPGLSQNEINVRDDEIIVGLQTVAPLKRAIMPNGGLRMVVDSLNAYGYELDPEVLETFTKYRKTHNSAVFDAYTPQIRRTRSRT